MDFGAGADGATGETPVLLMAATGVAGLAGAGGLILSGAGGAGMMKPLAAACLAQYMQSALPPDFNTSGWLIAVSVQPMNLQFIVRFGVMGNG